MEGTFKHEKSEHMEEFAEAEGQPEFLLLYWIQYDNHSFMKYFFIELFLLLLKMYLGYPLLMKQMIGHVNPSIHVSKVQNNF